MNRHKDYKEKTSDLYMNLGWNKRGQVAIFVIIAIVIVAVILVIFLRPRLGFTTTQGFSPEKYLGDCIEPNLRDNINKIASQGGYYNPEGFVVYNSTKVKYLCYTSQYYKTCMVQQPKLREHFEGEIDSLIKPKVEQCAMNLKAEYERQGYAVSLSQAEESISIVPGNIRINVIAPITITKESSENFRSFKVNIKSEMYDLIMTSVSIIDYESTYGDSETTLYMQYYPDLKIEKTKLSDGTTIYVLTNVISKESFTFASRSLAWPPGYGIEEVQ